MSAPPYREHPSASSQAPAPRSRSSEPRLSPEPPSAPEPHLSPEPLFPAQHPAPDQRPPGELLDTLLLLFRKMGSVLICYSGGIDSALLFALAHRALGGRAIGMTAVSPSLPRSELEEASHLALSWGADHRLVDSHEMLRPGYQNNGPDRCFHCKTELYEIAEAKRGEWDLAFIVNGTNTDDLGDYRPGLEAAKNAQVRSPYLEAGMNKSEVRALAAYLGIEIWNKPAAACLSSRLPYGTTVTRERLHQVERFEAGLRQMGFAQVRVRHHGELARIEVVRDELPRLLAPELHENVLSLGQECGFRFVTADLAGYRRGSLNELLAGRSLKVLS